MNRILSTITVLLALLMLWAPTSHSYAKQLAAVTGRITDSDNQPVIGASVIILSGEDILTGVSSDTEGRYFLKIDSSGKVLKLRVSAVGFVSQTVRIKENRGNLKYNLRLETQAVELNSIAVRPDKANNHREICYSSEKLSHNARRSLVPTNPVGALREPAISRQGSSHSSQIRINGTNPYYYLNGLLLGADPDHYGMFTIIPTSIIEEMKFYLQGTSARYALPSAIELTTPTPFEAHRKFEFNFSSIEATGVGSVGSDKTFLTASVRKSLLDKLVEQFDISSDRKTLPPTNFADFFMSAGVKLSPRYRLMADRYYVRDYLSYNTEAAVDSDENVRTFQHTDENYTAVRFDAVYEKLLLKFSAAQRTGYKEYHAVPETENAKEKVYLDLSEGSRTNLVNVQVVWFHKKNQLEIGDQLEFESFHEINMAQRNWNFLSPFANSDNPYIYQQALNTTYGTYYNRESLHNNAVYMSIKRDWGRFETETGFRLEYFKYLAKRCHPVWRQSVVFKTSEQSRLELFYGTFAESPVNNILEPYQVLINAHLNDLHPIKTQLVSISWANDMFEASLFNKKITGLPTVTPDFEQVFNKDGSLDNDFISVASTGEEHFYGGFLSFEKERFLTDRVDFRVSYAYTRAHKLDNGVNIPYDLNAPHKFQARIDYRISRKFDIGGEFQIRSGYPYTPARPMLAYSEPETYNKDYFTAAVEQENSEQFPTYLSLNLYGNYKWDNVEIFFGVNNVTNHANPIINAASGFVYDAGILPMLGIKWRF
ncbi:MAG: TonB-dependent receptor [candidate division Zixibacteria bacterium]|nr:TonB-dependent receptor [candidate division Zixibacteria bacterium]